LQSLGVARGKCVATLLGRTPELFTVVLGTLRAGRVCCSLFFQFGPEPLKTRLQLGHVCVLVTSEALYRRKLAPIRNALPELRHVLLVRDPGGRELPVDTADFAAVMSAAADSYSVQATRAEEVALLHFTSTRTCPSCRRVLSGSGPN